MNGSERSNLSRGTLLTRFLPLLGALASFIALSNGLTTLPESLLPPATGQRRVEFSDRSGVLLSLTKTNRWNWYDQMPLRKMPPLLAQAVVLAEDRRFFAHNGTDWIAVASAIRQNFAADRIVRGSSTISHQVVRMINPRPRTMLSRVLEVLDAYRLEFRFSKFEILEFYLNQVPLSGNVRGMVAGSKALFARSLETLTAQETIALALAIRNPTLYNPCRTSARAAKARALLRSGLGDHLGASVEEQMPTAVTCRSQSLPVSAPHFLHYVRNVLPDGDDSEATRVRTSLDSGLQLAADRILRQRLSDLSDRNVADGGVLVIDSASGEILAWVSQSREKDGRSSEAIDTVTALRQPGSTLKPFLYAMAFERGMRPDTEILDQPISRAVGTGVHAFRNYSGRFYGAISMTEALGNSLNTPAIRLIQLVGVDPFLSRLRELGFEHLTKPGFEYGEGLALGVGEVSLLELVRAYTSLVSDEGRRRSVLPFPVKINQRAPVTKNPVMMHAASLVRAVLEDPAARRLEFGEQGILDLPIRTAVKTGTSTDYRDAWAVGVNDRAVVGVWIGNLDGTAMKDVTGAEGAGVVLRAVFSEVEKKWDQSQHRASLRRSPLSIENRPFTERDPLMRAHAGRRSEKPRIQFPTPGLRIALDPRIPDSLERMVFELAPDPLVAGSQVKWYVDEKLIGTGEGDHQGIEWFPVRGHHVVQAHVVSHGKHEEIWSQRVGFEVR